MVNEWMDVSFKVGESKPEEYRFRPKRSSIHWFYGDSDMGNPFFSEFNIETYEYQTPNHKPFSNSENS